MISTITFPIKRRIIAIMELNIKTYIYYIVLIYIVGNTIALNLRYTFQKRSCFLFETLKYLWLNHVLLDQRKKNMSSQTKQARVNFNFLTYH